MELTLEVYGYTQQFPNTETYGLISQMRRAAVSVASNVAEGKGKSTDGEFAHFLGHARGSLHELETQKVIAGQFGYVSQDAIAPLYALVLETRQNALIQFLEKEVARSRSA